MNPNSTQTDSQTSVSVVPKSLIIPFILVTVLFFAWGIANNMTDMLLAAFKKIMSMSDFQTTFVQYAFYGAYFCFALPAAILIKKYTYKTGILIGLGMFIIGAMLFYPASQTMVYWHFLAALYILAGGLSFLETSANPFIAVMGSEKTSTQRLNLAQSFNPVGSITGAVLGQQFILTNLNDANAAERANMTAEQLEVIQTEELSAVMGPYVGIALVLLILWILIAITKMPKTSDEGGAFEISSALGRLVKNKNYVMAVLAQFFYVGAQICVWSFTIRFVMAELGINEAAAGKYNIYSLVVFLIARFVCTWLMQYIKPTKLLMYLAGLAVVLTGGVIYGSGMFAVVCLVAISGCMSLMFPTIYSLGLTGLGEDTKIGGSGLVMAILGGAVMTGIMGQVSDGTGSIHLAYWVPLLCFVFVVYYGYYAQKSTLINDQ